MIPVILLQIARTVGQALVSMAVTVLTGRAFRDLLYRILRRGAQKTHSALAEQLVEDVREDLGVPPPPPEVPESPIGSTNTSAPASTPTTQSAHPVSELPVNPDTSHPTKDNPAS